MSRIREVRSLAPAEIDAMWTLFSRHYDDVTRETFERDLARKQHVILLRAASDPGGAMSRQIVGFSTIEVDRRVVGGREVVSIFSGDTIVERRYWGTRALHRAFFRFVMALKLASPTAAVYWFLITKGYKTYLLLTRNFPEHWPRHDRPTPPWQQTILDELATRRFGDAYDARRGVLCFADSGHGRLRADVAPIDAALACDPDVRFFVERNPGAPRGDELCCLGRVGVGLAMQFGRKQLARALEGA
ncbi:hypothetical protein [Sandaracinus amylolyticus]|uniref:GNAT family N-acetyltransferase n=1 Tax=Sandaracinus amylolyticus TaxID=927083 RepID=A0A0F6W385_9BACT|nr:hypothetical protein [Sandaracinus amylolyticus]AKF06286.1 hypothetical protein DB32_003435 [Sandaracinus amylolyticus]